MHLDDEQVQRVLHGELDAVDALKVQAGAVHAHVAGCAACQARVDAARREEEQIFGLLRRLDRAAPGVAASTVAARAHGVTLRRVRWAAAVLFALTLAGAAYAAPGSPLPALVARLAGVLTGAPPAAVEPDGAGIVVVPGARFTIVFAAEHPAGTVTVSLTDGSSIVARRLDGSASFTSDVDRLTIAAGDATAAYEIELPRSAPWVEILAGGRRLLLKDGARIVTTPAAGAGGRYSLPLGPETP